MLAVGLVTFLAYGIDKRRAVHDKRRIPERVLHLFSWCGGWPGAIFGQETFRHKTQKASFRTKFWLIVVVHLSVILFALWLWLKNDAAA